MLPTVSGRTVRTYILTLAWKYIFYYVWGLCGGHSWSYFAAVHLEGFADKQNFFLVGKVVYNVLYSTWPLKLDFRKGPEK